MSKNESQRIEQTIVFLEHLPVLIHQFGPAAGHAIRKLPSPALAIVSKSMSLGAIAPHRRAQMQPVRNARRALILVRAVLLGEPVQRVRQAVDLIVDANVNQSLSQAITQWVQSEQQNLDMSFTNFANGTAAFLQAKKIQVDSTGGPGEVNYHWGWDELNDRFVLLGAATTRSPVIAPQAVFNIPTTRYTDVQATLDQIPSLKVTRSPCITTQLTGCSYVFHVDGNGELYVAHVWPKGDIPPMDLCSDLRKDGGLVISPGNAVKPSVFGACPANNGLDYKHTQTKTYVVAVGGTGNWQIHIQQQAGNAFSHWRIL